MEEDDIEPCSLCNELCVDGDSCMECSKYYCFKCIDNWNKLVKIKKSKDFNIYGDHNICISCAYFPLLPPKFEKYDEIEYNIELKRQDLIWFNKGYINDFKKENLDFDYGLIRFYSLCKKLEFFNNEFFNDFQTKQFYDDLENYIKSIGTIHLHGTHVIIKPHIRQKPLYWALSIVELKFKCKNLQSEILQSH